VARFNVGEAFLQVVASVENIHKTIAAEVAKIKDIQIDVTPNLEGFREKVAAGTAELADVDVNVKPDTTGFREKVKVAVAGIGSMDIPVRPDVDTTRANAQVGAFATELRAKLEAATKALGDIHMTADASDVDRKIAAVRAQLATLSNQRIGVDIDSAAASAKIKALEAELTSLGARSPNIQVKVDVAKATAELGAFRAILKDTENDGNLVSRALGGFASAAGSALSSLGSLVGSATSVGSALTSMGGSVSGASTSFASFGQAAGGAVSAVLPLLGTAASWAALGAAIAAAGSVAVGALGQIGGAAIALASGIVPLTTSLGLLPGLLAPLGIGLGTLTIGFSNTGKSGMEFKNTMDQLKSAFDPVINSIRSQMQPAIQTFIKSIQGLAPVVQSVVPQITAAVSQVTNSFSQLFKSSSFQNDLKTLLSGAAQNIKTFGDAAKNAFQGFMNIVVAAQPAVNRIAQDIDQAAQKFNQWTAAARQSGELTAMFQQAATVLEQLGTTLVNIAGLFKALWDSANRTGAFTSTLDAINQGITQFTDYVNQAGGAWDQLMSKAGSVTQSLVGLVGSIGNAFVTLGGQMDISGVIDTITQAINNMTPAFAQIGQAATPVFETIIEVAGRAAQALGPAFSEAITAIGTALKGIDWESTISGIALIIQGFTNLVNGATQAANVLNTLDSFLEGKGASWDDVTQSVKDFSAAISDTSGWDAAATSVQGLNDKIKGLPTDHNTTFNADGSPLQSTATQAQGWIAGVSGDWDTKFNGDASGVQGAAGQAGSAIQGVPTDHNTTLNADAQALISAATQGTQAIQGVVPDWLTKFAGDSASLVTAAQQADQQVQSVPVEKKVLITGDASGVSTATSQATSSLGAVADKNVNITATATNLTDAVTAATTALSGIADKAIKITADNADLTQKAQASVDSLNTVVDKNVLITADNSQALQAIQQVQTALAGLQNKTVTVTTNYVTTGTPPGQAAGAILPMATGGALSPMSGSTARIVPPNSWRVIGDRMRGDEAFIPINNSPHSQALLGETAHRMGQTLVPMHSGGINGQDSRAWDWLEDLLRRYRHGGHDRPAAPLPQQLKQTLGAPNVSRFGVGSTVGLSGSALPVTPAMLSTFYNPNPAIPSPPSTGGGHGGRGGRGDQEVRVTGDGPLFEAFMRMVRSEVRKRGGKAVLGV
jgi:hypothetical protein